MGIICFEGVTAIKRTVMTELWGHLKRTLPAVHRGVAEKDGKMHYIRGGNFERETM